ncbi:S41 family peptidase [Brevundimonas sp.]|uniref:S41 family peptidase n=1 Tax=Brevundimonas sp. TaxID=1871086 RepID=UPI002ABBA303|nr:PDZ domain-containing protein [Brevundimonas sp.]MDZ4362832.1 PDZ domain-containing protein [Brevundimonas sp.]
MTAAFALFPVTSAFAQDPEAFRDDARSIVPLIASQYAYPERFPDGVVPISPKLLAEAEAVVDQRGLLRYAERALMSLADHHAITGRSFNDSWAVVPTYADLWIVLSDEVYVIDAVRAGSPAADAGIRAGDLLVAVDDLPTAEAVTAFWADLGHSVTPERSAFAARVLAAGRRDRERRLTVSTADVGTRSLTLPNLYGWRQDKPPVTSSEVGQARVIRIEDSLGDTATIVAFDAAMAGVRPGQPIVIDLTETPSGGNTVVARAIMGWFVEAPNAYQVHSLPSEERQTGIGRRWVEQVLPRPGLHHDGPVTVRVGRWTGSMGEGLAVGFDALGARVEGSRMAGLLGAIYDHSLPNSGLVLKIPTERLETVDGLPREAFVPVPID